MLNKLSAGIGALALSALAVGCGSGNETTNANTANSNTTAAYGGGATGDARTAPDNSEIRTETVGGVTTETRTFRDPNGRIEKVVVTTRDGKRKARVYYRDKTVRDLPDNEVERALDATGDALVSAGGTVVDASKAVGSEVGDKAEDVGGAAVSGAKKVGSEVGDKAEDVGDATAKGAKKVGREAADKAEDVGGATVNGAKKAGKATVKGAKKVGGAIKDAVTP